MQTKLRYMMAVGLLASLITACSRNTAIPEARPKPSEVKGDYFFVTESAEHWTTDLVVAEATMFKPLAAILRLDNLTPGKPYSAHFSLHNPNGQRVLDEEIAFTPQEPRWYIWQCFTPDPSTNPPGRWKWTVSGKNISQHSTVFTLLPPTPAELESLALHEKAREEVFRAFSQNYLGRSNRFFTMVAAYAKPAQYVGGQLARPSTRSDAQPTQVGLVEFGGLHYSFGRESLSEADALNGITYKGTATFGCDVYRLGVPERGWSEWKDVSSAYGLPNELRKGLLDPLDPGYGAGSLQWNFTIQQKDGSWWVTSDVGCVWANGKFVRVDGQKSHDLRLLISPPSVDLVDRWIKIEGSQRTLDRAIGMESKASPAEIERNAISTIAMLRGRHLAQ